MNNFKIFRLFLVILILLSEPVTIPAQTKHLTGLILNPVKYAKIETISPALKFTEPDKDIYSLKQYCPTPGDQGQIGSCTSWATGYAALTISQAIAENNTNTKDITNRARSALYIYNQIKKGGCKDGAQTEDAIKLVQEKGDCDFKDFNPNDCRVTPSMKEDAEAKDYKIKDHYTLWNNYASPIQKILTTINSLSSSKPVIISLALKASFNRVSNDGLYNPKDYEKDDGYHALCVIGYDNTKKRFEIINSWGTNWGNKGFFYISYEDYGRYCKEGYQFSIAFKEMPKQQIQGGFQLSKYSGKDENGNNQFKSISTFYGSDNFYHTSTTINLDDFFRLKARNLIKDSYVYIFSYKPNNTSEILFPLHYNSKNSVFDIPLVTSSNSILELPENYGNAYSAEQRGEDILCILYSNKRIVNLDRLIKEIPNYNGDLWKWYKDLFKKDSIDPSYITYSPFEMGINTKVGFKGSIVPLFFKVKVQ